MSRPLIRIPKKASPLAFVGLLGIFLGLSAWATDYCPILLDRLRGSEQGAKIGSMVERRSFQKFYGLPELKPIVQAIAELKPIRFGFPFELTGSVREDGNTLIIHLDGIGPPVGSPLPAGSSSIKDAKGVHAGFFNPYNAEKTSNPRMIKAVTAVLEGAEARLKANPNLTKIVFQTKDVVNLSLKAMLQEKMGMKVIRSRSIGLSTSAETFELEVELVPPSSGQR